MKKKQIINYILLTVVSVALAVFGCRCTTTKSDPLAGWQRDFNKQPNQLIVDDYQNYIKQLPPRESRLATVDDWLKDKSGKHAIKITVGLDGTDWEHVLIYDKNNKRIKTIKYVSGHSHS